MHVKVYYMHVKAYYILVKVYYIHVKLQISFTLYLFRLLVTTSEKMENLKKWYLISLHG